jgi:hypothetical protein
MFAGVGAARGYSILTETGVGPVMPKIFAAEVSAAILALIALRLLSRS